MTGKRGAHEGGAGLHGAFTPASLQDLCQKSGFVVNEIGYCSFWLRQNTTGLIRILNSVLGLKVTWVVTLPFRAFSIGLSSSLGRLLSLVFDRPGYSITLDA